MNFNITLFDILKILAVVAFIFAIFIPKKIITNIILLTKKVLFLTLYYQYFMYHYLLWEF